jgi:hypothetical protein
MTRLMIDIARRIKSHNKKKGYLKYVDGFPVLLNTEEIALPDQDERNLPLRQPVM